MWCDSELAPTASHFEHLYPEWWGYFAEPSGSSTCLSEVVPLQAERPLTIIALLLLSSHSMPPLGPPHQVAKSSLSPCKLFLWGILVKVANSSGNAGKSMGVVEPGLRLLSVSFKV